MNETKKTGIFWAVALVIFAIGVYAAWPTQTRDTAPIAGTTLFEKFSDPLAASNLKVVSFDEDKGELEEFVVRKNDGEIWSIQSKSDYPADALEQVTKAANSLIGLKVLDVQTTNPEDHDDLGVVEPDVRQLEVGDEGVGRLVTFRDKARETLASIIIGDAVKDADDERYVRIPGQDPVYRVKFDPAVVTTNFQDWIEEDLLQLSSIEIDRVTVDDYEASLAGGGRFSLNRNYTYTVAQQDSDWSLERLAEYGENPLDEPTPVDPPADQSLDTTKLNDMKNALDDLKFVDVYRKPKGIGATLQADAELVKDEETVRSLVTRGFYPVTIGDANKVELMSANGEMQVNTKDGVQYVLRFGNISGVGGDDDASGDEADADAAADREGVNRYLLVTTNVNESQFPVPELKSIPKSVEELKAMRAAEEKAANMDEVDSAESETAEANEESSPAEPADEAESADGEAMQSGDEDSDTKPDADSDQADDKSEQMSEAESGTESSKGDAAENGEESAEKKETETESTEVGSSKEETSEADSTETPEKSVEEVTEDADASASDSGSADAEGSATAEGSGGGQTDDEATSPQDEDDSSPDGEAASDNQAEQPAKADADATGDGEQSKAPAAKTELTDVEWQELLEAEQEKIQKENQRLLDARRDDIEAAGRKVSQLNERFANWYYVIPESTYRKLRISRDELFAAEESADGDAAADALEAAPGPSLNLPGIGN